MARSNRRLVLLVWLCGNAILAACGARIPSRAAPPTKHATVSEGVAKNIELRVNDRPSIDEISCGPSESVNLSLVYDLLWTHKSHPSKVAENRSPGYLFVHVLESDGAGGERLVSSTQIDDSAVRRTRKAEGILVAPERPGAYEVRLLLRPSRIPSSAELPDYVLKSLILKVDG